VYPSPLVQPRIYISSESPTVKSVSHGRMAYLPPLPLPPITRRSILPPLFLVTQKSSTSALHDIHFTSYFPFFLWTHVHPAEVTLLLLLPSHCPLTRGFHTFFPPPPFICNDALVPSGNQLWRQSYLYSLLPHTDLLLSPRFGNQREDSSLQQDLVPPCSLVQVFFSLTH